MLRYIAYRLLLMIPTIIVVSIVSFTIIQLPPGDFLTSYVANLEAMGERIDDSQLNALKQAYGLGEPLHIQYIKWVTGMLHGDFGRSFTWRVPVSTLIWERLGLKDSAEVARSLAQVRGDHSIHPDY